MERGKTDAADAEVICGAVTRPAMRFVSAKFEEQQAALIFHKTRDLIVRQRTMLQNALRVNLVEYVITKAQRPRRRRLIVSVGPGSSRCSAGSCAIGPAERRGSVPCAAQGDQAS